MFKKIGKPWLFAVVSLVSVALVGCGESKYVEQEKYQRIQTNNSEKSAIHSLSALEKELKAGTMRNAKLISLYADEVEKINPELKIIINELRKDAGTDGALYRGLVQRLKANKIEAASVSDLLNKSNKKDQDYFNAITKYSQKIQPEYDAIIGASQVAVYNDALSDVVNALADMSKDTLARVDGKKSSDFYKETGAKNVGAATMLVGNENYGGWKQDSNGNSFWEFYGQMMFLNAMLDMGGGRGYYYNDWNRSRPYSSYNDHYRKRYASSSVRNSRSKLNSHYKIKPGTKSKASTAYVKKNPAVTKKFQKFDNQFAKKRPTSKVVSRGTAKPRGSVSKVSTGNKWGSQYSRSTGSKTTRSTSGSRSSRGGK